MKKSLLLLLVLSQTSLAQSSMDEYRWYLDPNGQEVLVSIDDLHDERLTASPSMNWGREVIPSITLKKDIVIAVIDGGFDIKHPELKDSIFYNSAECNAGNSIPPQNLEDRDGNGMKGDCAGWNFVSDNNLAEDLDGHGTHVTGIMQSVLSGIKGNFKFLPLKVFAANEGRQGGPQIAAPLSTRLNKAFQYAMAQKVDVIHLSVGWPKSFMSFELENTIKAAIAQGIAVVSAAGNSSQRATIFPCKLEGVICVGALRANGEVARFSNWGMQVDIFAPGERILSTIPYELTPTQISRKGYDFKNGTSQAAPFISAAMAILKGAYPEESADTTYARLMLGADSALQRKGLKGLFHLDHSINLKNTELVYPVLKGISSITLKENGRFTLDIPLRNYGLQATSRKVQLSCQNAVIDLSQRNVALKYSEEQVINYAGTLTTSALEMNCDLKVGDQTVALKLKVLNQLPEHAVVLVAPQSTQLVVNTRNGGRSRLATLTALPGSQVAPYYGVMLGKELTIFEENVVAGKLSPKEGCSILRTWQGNLNNDGINDIMLESLCDKIITYRFFDHQLKEIYKETSFKPTLTILNYQEFDLVIQKDLPPTLRFLNVGYAISSNSPWDAPVSGRALHYYELSAVADGANYKYDVRILENSSNWQKSLNLRYLPETVLFHKLGDDLLVKIGAKFALVNIQTQNARWAPQFDKLLLDGTRKQQVLNSSLDILQGFLTPYEYRGYLLSGISLKFSQTNRFDPLIDILGTVKNEKGYLTVLQSFQKLVYLQFDAKGILLSQTETVVDRFDFLTSQDFLASVVNLKTPEGLVQLVDGTKLNTNYVDVTKMGQTISYEVPTRCVTQQPVFKDQILVLPVFCPLGQDEFEMKFIKL